ncbi:MAG TPA: hypothetical protein VMT00_15860 [Thermoanaerobaculia bacterium]|nr:hypothetical protein [Thermoanaerobaculia bacterium]
MSSLRRNPLNGEWIIIAPERRDRPNAITVEPEADDDPQQCPFCPGNEGQTPPEIMRVGSEDRWNLRVVPNRYPAVRSDARRDHSPAADELIDAGLDDEIDMPADGSHEVIVESREHTLSADGYSTEMLECIFDIYEQRYAAQLDSSTPVRHVTIFKNSSSMSGASILHPHSQLLSLPVVPARPAIELSQFARRAGDCPLCAQLGRNRLFESGRFLVVAPHASRLPFQLLLAPRAHTPSFFPLPAEPRRELAALLQMSLRALAARLGRIPFNWTIQTSPMELGLGRREFHSYLELFPRLTTIGGFEWSSSSFINIVPPELAVVELRDAFERKGQRFPSGGDQT